MTDIRSSEEEHYFILLFVILLSITGLVIALGVRYLSEKEMASNVCCPDNKSSCTDVYYNEELNKCELTMCTRNILLVNKSHCYYDPYFCINCD